MESVSEPWVIQTSGAGNADLSCALSTSHKRVNCNPEFCVPEAKRQQLSSLFDSDLPCLRAEEGKPEMNMFGMSAATLIGPLESKMAPTGATATEEQANIANSSNYIDSLLDIIGAGDDFNDNDPIDIATQPEDNVIEEDDLADALLNNLPTSVDDFQNKEFSLKLERNYSSPMISRRQSPICPALDVSCYSSAASECSGLIGSRTQSVSSNPQIAGAGDLDADDLEVAMINESFEEQQKQSKLYGGMNLKSLFYGKQSVQEDIDESQLDDIIFNTSDSKSNTSKVVELTESSEYDSQEDEDDEDNCTPPIDISEKEFIPLLTPKSSEFVHRRKSTKAAELQQLISSATSKGISISSSLSKVCTTPLEDDEEKSRRLDMELEKMMLEEDDLLYSKSFEDREDGCPIPVEVRIEKNGVAVPYEKAVEEPSEEENSSLSDEAAAKVAYGVIASLFNSTSPVVLEEKYLSSETIDITDDSFFTSNLSFLTPEKEDEGLDTSGHFSSVSDEPLKKVDQKEEGGGGGSGLYANSSDSSGHSSSATISSTASSDECQKVPVVDSWEELEDSAIAVNMLNEVKTAFDLAKMAKNEYLLSSSASGTTSSTTLRGNQEAQELAALSHVLEAHTSSVKQEAEMTELLQIMGLGTETWLKKVDDRHYLVVFPSAAKASEALFANSKRSSNGIKLQLLSEASQQSRTKACKWKSTLKAKSTGPRPQTTASVARRMIANSLNRRIDVSSEQKEKEATQMIAAKEQKRQKSAIWGEND